MGDEIFCTVQTDPDAQAAVCTMIPVPFRPHLGVAHQLLVLDSEVVRSIRLPALSACVVASWGNLYCSLTFILTID